MTYNCREHMFVYVNSNADGSAGVKDEFEHVLNPTPLLRLVIQLLLSHFTDNSCRLRWFKHTECEDGTVWVKCWYSVGGAFEEDLVILYPE